MGELADLAVHVIDFCLKLDHALLLVADFVSRLYPADDVVAYDEAEQQGGNDGDDHCKLREVVVVVVPKRILLFFACQNRN